jgi:DNA/RNA-binding domain of Phe-tRNA-synthetase-like protein
VQKFIIEDDFWSLFPRAKVGVVLSRGINNSIRNVDVYEKMLEEAGKEALRHIEMDDFSRNSAVFAWREAFQKFKTKKGARSSIEALLKRVKNGNSIRPINPLVDIYNSISLRYGLPCGGEDIDAFVGNIRLTKATGKEAFVPLGSEENASPYEGEIIYKDDAGAICRCWNWREALRTMLTENTKNAFLCLELVDETRIDEFHMALKELAELVSHHLGGKAEIHELDKNKKEIMLQNL